MYKDCYIGSMTKDIADTVLDIQSSDVVSELKNSIYNLSEDMISYIKIYGSLPKGTILPRGTMEDYQTVGTACMYFAKRMLLGDSVGLGKTVQTAGLINLISVDNINKGLGDAAFLFLAEKTAVPEIRNKMIQFTAQYVHAMTGVAKDVDEFLEENEEHLQYSVVASHSLISNPKFIKWLYMHKGEFDVLIFDESSTLKNKSSGKTGAVSTVSDWFEYFYMLNATPVEIDLREFYTQLSVVDKQMMPTITEFENEFTEKHYKGYSVSKTYKNADVFRDRIRLRYYARTRKGLGAKYENNNGDVYISELTPAQKSLMNKTTLWRMVCDCPTALDSSIEFEEENVPKLRDLRGIIEGLGEEDNVMIYCYYKETQAYIQDYLSGLFIESEIINGDTKMKERERILYSFNNKQIKVLITNIQKSIDLKSCNHCIFYSFDFNPQKMVQIEGRITRSFDVENKNIYLLCSAGREQKFMQEVLHKRAKMSSEFAETDESMIMNILLQNKDKIES